jgi:hypothetical protein
MGSVSSSCRRAWGGGGAATRTVGRDSALRLANTAGAFDSRSSAKAAVAKSSDKVAGKRMAEEKCGRCVCQGKSGRPFLLPRACRRVSCLPDHSLHRWTRESRPFIGAHLRHLARLGVNRTQVPDSLLAPARVNVGPALLLPLPPTFLVLSGNLWYLQSTTTATKVLLLYDVRTMGHSMVPTFKPGRPRACCDFEAPGATTTALCFLPLSCAQRTLKRPHQHTHTPG